MQMNLQLNYVLLLEDLELKEALKTTYNCVT